MFKKMSWVVGTLALALCAGPGTRAYAQAQQNNTTTAPAATNLAPAPDLPNGSASGPDLGRRRSRRGGRAGRGMAGGTLMGGGVGGGATTMAEPGAINWSRRYQLTPLDQKRLQAMGLLKEEVWAIARAAHESDEDVDEVAQMRLRGRSFWQIADELNIPYESMLHWPQRWQSEAWAEAVREGSPAWYPRLQATTSEKRSERRARRGSMGGAR